MASNKKRKKVSGKNARFGSRYGSRIRKRVSNIENKYKGKCQICPFCGVSSARRTSAGVYQCKTCKKKFAGGAYEPSTVAKRVLGKLYDKKGNLLSSGISLEEIETLVDGVVEPDLEKSKSEKHTHNKKEKEEK